ncbi:phospholipid-translocating P-type ATPase, flippase [Spizellomyces punctatus DAOM BR117]|uniref:Phospholipid-transporting ATPase n=1 Tax=Spizellomyces punctatus (strain DAOM BR117) TaxID=645134 RepID=A0A0L0H3Y1_SPIPD|nr:phospholipid-translocating P-type ATPase, flippase [Spizellomyces punctatus DAOM BR117]KNC95912.1 phospholipid-translocating P-type ATPase, flippase [Spizellomyces punctatus DAOM BR117]|eukprot:XP_016603952.1 phospholipid-translocating P-type ATPase, flippase [Spizellomyces punctatus DAOM BR117]
MMMEEIDLHDRQRGGVPQGATSVTISDPEAKPSKMASDPMGTGGPPADDEGNGTLSRAATAIGNFMSTLERGGGQKEEERIIYLNDPIKNSQSKYLHNSISTAKYNLVTFLPKFLAEQFSRYANLFFLFTGIIQQIGDLSPTSKFGTLVPLGIVLFASGVKEVVEDTKRHRQDAEVNARFVKCLKGSEFVPKRWREVQVGDIVRIENGEFFPADLILLSSSEPDALCYIETSNLDGETNLKIRQGLTETADVLTPEAVARLHGLIKSEQPNNSLYTYEGLLRLGNKSIPLDPQQLLLRGAQLRNTRWVYAIVVFTGHETKLMRNATAAPIKRTKVERMVNTQIIFLFLILLAMAVFCSIGALVRQLNNPFEKTLLLYTSNAWAMFPQNILTYIILFNNLIPLSLIVTMEAVKFVLGGLINTDLDMYHEESDTHAVARTSSLVEELGQVDYIFSDKTGTLTRNIMEFKMASIGGVAYADVVPEDKKIRVDEKGHEVGYYDFKQLLEHKKTHANAPLIREFVTLLAVCHTVIPEVDEEDPSNIIYQASSPDEAALVKGAQQLGGFFHTRRPKSVTIKLDGRDLEYEVLNVNEFNSTRKRMSLLVRTPEGKIKLYIKGADTVILERLAKEGNGYVEQTCGHLEEYATEGLRTLCIAYRDISNEEYAKWAGIYEKAATTINNRQDELDKAAEMIEKDLILIGATAIEDKLQDGVPDTIATLALAGIKIWVLTGDRQETAINIGYSCKLLNLETSLIVCNESTHFETKEFLEKKLLAVKAGLGMGAPMRRTTWFDRLLGKKERRFDKDAEVDLEPLALIIDGRTLDFALEDDIKFTFLELATLCKAVVCCRVSPLQKALVVKLVRKNVDESVTLAIGDGANDVGMIQAAHVGIGISGQEGLQAARSADFAIAQFRFLRKLLLIHGGWAYARMSKLILYSYYKNITLYLIQLWFAIDNGFSGQTLFETWSSVSSYNVLWAVAQPIAIGIFDQYVSARMLDRYPQMYNLGQRSIFYNHKVFFSWLVNSFYHSAMVYYLWRAVVWSSGGAIMGDGRVADNWSIGEMVYATDLVVIGWKAALTVDIWVKFTWVAIVGSVLLFLVLFPIYAIIGPLIKLSPELFGINQAMFGNAVFWLGLLLFPIAANLRDFTWKYAKRTYFPKSYHIIQEVQKYNIPDYRPRMEWFRKAVHKVRMIQRLKRQRGFAFSQNESGQAGLIRAYDTTRRKPRG